MTVKLDKKWVEYLSRQPETGMGYQVVDVRLKDNRMVVKVVVFNSEEIELPEEAARVGIQDLTLHVE